MESKFYKKLEAGYTKGRNDERKRCLKILKENFKEIKDGIRFYDTNKTLDTLWTLGCQRQPFVSNDHRSFNIPAGKLVIL